MKTPFHSRFLDRILINIEHLESVRKRYIRLVLTVIDGSQDIKKQPREYNRDRIQLYSVILTLSKVTLPARTLYTLPPNSLGITAQLLRFLNSERVAAYRMCSQRPT